MTTEIQAEIAPFTHALKSSHGGGEEMKPGALSFIPDLSAKLFELLDQYDRYNYILKNKNNFNTITMHSCGQLTWHDGVIPSNEIWG